MKIEISDIAAKQIIAETKKKKLENPVLTVKSSSTDYCCGPPILKLKISEKKRIASSFELIGEALKTPVYLERDVLPDSKKARLLVASIGPNKELTAMLVLP